MIAFAWLHASSGLAAQRDKNCIPGPITPQFQDDLAEAVNTAYRPLWHRSTIRDVIVLLQKKRLNLARTAVYGLKVPAALQLLTSISGHSELSGAALVEAAEHEYGSWNKAVREALSDSEMILPPKETLPKVSTAEPIKKRAVVSAARAKLLSEIYFKVYEPMVIAETRNFSATEEVKQEASLFVWEMLSQLENPRGYEEAVRQALTEHLRNYSLVERDKSYERSLDAPLGDEKNDQTLHDKVSTPGQSVTNGEQMLEHKEGDSVISQILATWQIGQVELSYPEVEILRRILLAATPEKLGIVARDLGLSRSEYYKLSASLRTALSDYLKSEGIELPNLLGANRSRAPIQITLAEDPELTLLREIGKSLDLSGRFSDIELTELEKIVFQRGYFALKPQKNSQLARDLSITISAASDARGQIKTKIWHYLRSRGVSPEITDRLNEVLHYEALLSNPEIRYKILKLISVKELNNEKLSEMDLVQLKYQLLTPWPEKDEALWRKNPWLASSLGKFVTNRTLLTARLNDYFLRPLNLVPEIQNAISAGHGIPSGGIDQLFWRWCLRLPNDSIQWPQMTTKVREAILVLRERARNAEPFLTKIKALILQGKDLPSRTEDRELNLWCQTLPANPDFWPPMDPAFYYP